MKVQILGSGTAPNSVSDNSAAEGSGVVRGVSAVSATLLISTTSTIGNSPESPNASSGTTNENVLNEIRLNSFRANYSQKLLQLIRDTPVEFGEAGPIEKLVQKMIASNRLAALALLQELVTQSFKKRDEESLIGILVAVARLGESVVGSQGAMMASNALLFPSAAGKEAGIRVFESWGSASSIEYLEALDIQEKWLADYRSDVVEYIRSKHAPAHPQN